MKEDALFEGLKQRDPDALTFAFERYSDKIYRLAVSILHDEQQADGVVQDTFIKLIHAVDSFEGRIKFVRAKEGDTFVKLASDLVLSWHLIVFL